MRQSESREPREPGSKTPHETHRRQPHPLRHPIFLLFRSRAKKSEPPSNRRLIPPKPTRRVQITPPFQSLFYAPAGSKTGSTPEIEESFWRPGLQEPEADSFRVLHISRCQIMPLDQGADHRPILFSLGFFCSYQILDRQKMHLRSILADNRCPSIPKNLKLRQIAQPRHHIDAQTFGIP